MKSCKIFQTHQTVRRSIPYTEKKQVCSRTQLWHVSTPVVYPWSPVIMPFVVRGANLDYCADLGIDELTEEDLEIYEALVEEVEQHRALRKEIREQGDVSDTPVDGNQEVCVVDVTLPESRLVELLDKLS